MYGDEESSHSDPGEDILQHALRSQIRKQSSSKSDDKPLNLSKDEAEKFQKAFEDSDFRKLMAEYVSEISDPKNRAEQDEYIRQLEKKNEIPKGKDIIRPQAGFVLKFWHVKKVPRSAKGQKVIEVSEDFRAEKAKLFVNIVHSDQIGKPTAERSSITDKNQQTKKGHQWSLPYSLGPIRMEEDKSKELVPTLDCCFHPATLSYALRSDAFRDLIAETAREGVKQAFESSHDSVVIDKQYRILKGVSFKNGTPPVMVAGNCCMQGHKSDSLECGSDTVMNTDTNLPTKPNRQSDDSGVQGVKAKENFGTCEDRIKGFGSGLNKGFFMKAQSTKRTKKKRIFADEKSNDKVRNGGGGKRGGNTDPEGHDVPLYTVVERGLFEIADHTLDGMLAPSRRPRWLVYRIELPKLSDSNDVHLDVGEENMVLQSKANATSNYRLDVSFPYHVVCEDAEAKMDKAKKTLTVKVPVQRPHVAPEMLRQNFVIAEEELTDSSGDANAVTEVDKMNDATHSQRDTWKANDHCRWVELTDRNQPSERETFATDMDIPTISDVSDEVEKLAGEEDEENISHSEDSSDGIEAGWVAVKGREKSSSDGNHASLENHAKQLPSPLSKSTDALCGGHKDEGETKGDVGGMKDSKSFVANGIHDKTKSKRTGDLEESVESCSATNGIKQSGSRKSDHVSQEPSISSQSPAVHGGEHAPVCFENGLIFSLD